MKATDAYKKINRSPIKGIVLYYTEQLKKEIGTSKIKDVILDIQTGKTPPKANPKYYSSEDINWFKPSDIGYSKYLTEAKEKFSQIALKEKKGTLYPPNTLLIIGIGGGVGRVSILKESGSSNQQITGITFKESISPEYAYYYFLVREDYIKSLAKSMSFPILNQEKLKGLDFCFPKIEQQNQFVKFIDECWNCFESGIVPDFSNFLIDENLKEYALKQFKIINQIDTFSTENQTQSQLLSQLHQSILQEAIQGKLTKNWRKENPNIEPAEKLLQRIKSEKEQLIKEKKIKVGKKQASNDIGDIKFELPKEWVFVELDDITQFITDGTHQTPKYTEKGRVFLSAQNIKPFKFMPENHKYISEEAYQEIIAGKEPEKGDLLVGRVGSKGETAVIDREIDFAYYVSLGLVKTFKEFTSPKYLAIVMNSPFGNRYAVGNMSSIGAAAGNFNLGRIRSFPIPLPPLSEQHAIVEQVEKLLGKCDLLQTEIVNLNTQSKTLLKAIFNETFATEATA